MDLIRQFWHGNVEFVFSVHAVFRAEERGISGAELRSAIHCGKFEEFGNKMVRITRNSKKGGGRVVLVGRFVSQNCIKIVTVER